MKKLKKLLEQVRPETESLSGAMKAVAGSNTTKLDRGIGGPYKPFPNVKDFKVELSAGDEICLAFGIRKRLAPPVMHFEEYRNRSMNRYVEHQLRRMSKANDRLFGTIAIALLKRSNVGFLLSLKAIFPRGHREVPLRTVLNGAKQFRSIPSKPFTDIDFKRVYIEKANGKWRPLGVPRPIGRIYLHALNQFLVLRYDKHVSNNQHGFRPGRGTLTAWTEILEHAQEYPYIAEFDYKGFFDKIKIEYVSKVLREYKLPGGVVYMLETLNKSIPKLAEEDKISEVTNRKYPLTGSLKPNPNREEGRVYEVSYFIHSPIFGKVQRGEKLLFSGGKGGFADYPTIEIPTEQLKQGKPEDIVPVHDIKMKALDEHGHGNYPLTKQEGLPQGSPTSPFLSILADDFATKGHFENLGIKVIKYADDGIAMAKHPFNLRDCHSYGMTLAGIQINYDKSGGVRYEGKWLKPLKFLGLQGDGTTLQANTRKGSKLIYDKDSLLEALEQGYIGAGNTSAGKRKQINSGERLIRSRLTGFIQNRLYSGSGNLDDFKQSFELTFRAGTGVDVAKKVYGGVRKYHRAYKRIVQVLQRQTIFDTMNVFNSSSLAAHNMLEILRLAEGKRERRPTAFLVRQVKVNSPKPHSFKDQYATGNARRGMMGYCQSPEGFITFVIKEIDRMAPYSKYSREEMLEHYWESYVRRKSVQIEHVLRRGEGIIAEVERTLQL